MSAYDVGVVGAGPAGLAAAVRAATLGARVVVVDQAPRIGGSYFRHSAEHSAALRPGALHHDWLIFTALQSQFEDLCTSGAITFLPQHAVWALEAGFVVHAMRGERERAPVRVVADRLVVATGSYDRTIAFPGWTLPGVLTAGGAQALLKGSLTTPLGRIVVAGAGPLLLVVAAGLLRAGADVVTVAEHAHPLRYALRPRAWSGVAGRLGEAAAYARELAVHRVPYLAGHQIAAAHGDDRLRSVDIRSGSGRLRSLDCDALLISYGFTPQVELLTQLGAGTHLDADGSVVVDVDANQRTTVAGLYAAGETTGVGGARLALLEGWVAGNCLGLEFLPPPTTRESYRDPGRVRARIASHRAFARSMHEVHAVSGDWAAGLPDETVVCRCEEVTAGALRAAQDDLGADDVRTAKLMTRAGMGLCQGRVCVRLVDDLLASRTRSAPHVAGRVNLPQSQTSRPIAQPVPLSVLATLGYREVHAAVSDIDGRLDQEVSP